MKNMTRNENEWALVIEALESLKLSPHWSCIDEVLAPFMAGARRRLARPEVKYLASLFREVIRAAREGQPPPAPL